MAKRASSGHKLGQLVGDWFEQYFSLPLLRQVADELELYLDNRFVSRPLRGGEKVIWRDVDGNAVDYDFVLELGGSDEERGFPWLLSNVSGGAVLDTPKTKPATTVEN